MALRPDTQPDSVWNTPPVTTIGDAVNQWRRSPPAETEVRHTVYNYPDTPSYLPEARSSYKPDTVVYDDIGNDPSKIYREGIFREFGFTPEAAVYLRNNTGISVDQSGGQSGGGYWHPAENRVELFSTQPEAAVHELSHAWWEQKRKDPEVMRNFVNDTIGSPPAADVVWTMGDVLLNEYTQPTQIPLRPLMEVPAADPQSYWYPTGWNDHEIYAGLASGTMGDTSRMPPQVQPYYQDLFLPKNNPWEGYFRQQRSWQPPPEPYVPPPPTSDHLRGVTNQDDWYRWNTQG